MQRALPQDEKNQLLITCLWLNLVSKEFCPSCIFSKENIPQNWLDYQLNWNISEYGGVKSIRVHPKLIWTPDLLMYNRLYSLSFTSIGC